jgi:hypothetical protein
MFSTLVRKGSKYLGEIREEVKLISAAVGEGRSAVKLARSEITALSKAGEAASAAQAARIAAAEKNAERVTSNLVSLEKNAARISAEERASRAVSIVEKPNGTKVLQVDPNIHIPEVKPSQLGYTPHGIDKITDKAALRAMIGEEKAAKMGLHEIENVVELRNKVKKFLDEEGRLFNKDNTLVRAANNVAVNGTRAVAKRERSASQESDDLMGCIIQRGGQQGGQRGGQRGGQTCSTPTPVSSTPVSKKTATTNQTSAEQQRLGDQIKEYETNNRIISPEGHRYLDELKARQTTVGNMSTTNVPQDYTIITKNSKKQMEKANEIAQTQGKANITLTLEQQTFFDRYFFGLQKKANFIKEEKFVWTHLPNELIDVLTAEQLKIYIRRSGNTIPDILSGLNVGALRGYAKLITDTTSTIDKTKIYALLETYETNFLKVVKEAVDNAKKGIRYTTDAFLKTKGRTTVSSIHNTKLRDLNNSEFTAFSKTTPDPKKVTCPCQVDHIVPVNAFVACLQKLMKDTGIKIENATLERLSTLLNDEKNLEWLSAKQNNEFGQDVKEGLSAILGGTYTPPPKPGSGMARLQDGLEKMVDRTFHLNDNSKAFNAIEHLYAVVKGPAKTPFLTGGGRNEELEEIKNIMEKFVIGLETGNFDEKTKEFAQIYYATINDEEEGKQDEEEEYIEPRSKVFSNILNPEEPAEEPVAQPQVQPQVQPQPQAQPQAQTKVSASTGLSTPPAPRQGGTRKNRPYKKSNTYRK